MRQDFRPTQEQLDYLNIDMIPFLEELGCDVINNEYYIRSIDWYNWDDKPRWFVNIGIFNITDWKQAGYIEVDMDCEAWNGPDWKQAGYIEVDMDCEAWNGPDHPMGIESVEYAGHGFPCISTTIAQLNKETEQYIISKIDQ